MNSSSSISIPVALAGPSLAPEVFFEVVDNVLKAEGREPLDSAGPQRKIIEVRDADRVLQILAGPGSGKTEMLVLRVLYDIFVRGTDAARMIVTTFTRRAASELVVRTVERAEAIQTVCTTRGISVRDPQIHNLRIGTIHSLCEQILVEHDSEYRDAGRTMIDQAEAYARMSRKLYELGRRQGAGAVDRLINAQALKALFTPPWEDNARMLGGMRIVEVLTDMIAQHVETWVPRCEAAGTPNGVEVVHNIAGLTDDLQKVTARWEAILNEASIVDFATIQRLFRNRQHLFTDRFDHVFVDEFQDSNPVQLSIHVGWLAHPGTRLTVVADDDQSLYRFRGSDIECLIGLKPYCLGASIPFRMESLETNYRSTKRIVQFTQAFRNGTVLATAGLPKTIVPSPKASLGDPVRLLSGSWTEVCRAIASDLADRNVGRPAAKETAAVLMFSTRESDSQRNGPSPALTLRRAIEARGLRVFNLSSKTAAEKDSPVTMLLGLLSYLVDPVTLAVPEGGQRRCEVWASSPNSAHAAVAASVPPGWRMNGHHIKCQKWFIKHGNGRIGAPEPNRKRLTDYLDRIRSALVNEGEHSRLTLAGLIARLLTDPFFRSSGFTPEMFRQALFTQLFEANVAPTRLTMKSLDNSLAPKITDGKVEWDDSIWQMLHAFGGYLENVTVEDVEVEAFEQDAVLMMTHHRAKGLEFDHVVVAGLGRELDYGPVLRTRCFSGEQIPYEVTDTSVETNDQTTIQLALADREREAYVALSRAKSTLTILHGTDDPPPMLLANPTISTLFSDAAAKIHPSAIHVEVRTWE